MNSIAHRDGTYWLSSYRLMSLYVVHGDTGVTLATIGGPGGDVQITVPASTSASGATTPTSSTR